MDRATDLIMRTETRRREASAVLDPRRRVEFGQFFTPAPAADLIAAMPIIPETGTLRVLDPGAGVGSLTAALTARLLREKPRLSLDLVAVESEPVVAPYLRDTLADCEEAALAYGTRVTTTMVSDDIISCMTGFGRMSGPLADLFDIVIMNPPYRKLGVGSYEREALLADSVDCANLYCTFLALGVIGLKPQGQIVAITPRSFANGPYFGAFRRFFLSHMTLNRLHVFESRSEVFADSDVLQENIVFTAVKNMPPSSVAISVSRSHTDEAVTRVVAYADIIRPGDLNQFIHIPAEDKDEEVATIFAGLPSTLADLGVQVSTGRVVDFRAREYLVADSTPGSVPLIYPGNLRDGRVQWPLPIRKPQSLINCQQTQKLLLPSGRYVVVKRFSAKEERRRVVAVICGPEDAPAAHVGFENHLNVFHNRNSGLDEWLAAGLALWLNSTVVDTYFRIFSGHTQVNATDLRSLRYPLREQLTALGEALGQGAWPDQEKIDSLVKSHVLAQGNQ